MLTNEPARDDYQPCKCELEALEAAKQGLPPYPVSSTTMLWITPMEVLAKFSQARLISEVEACQERLIVLDREKTILRVQLAELRKTVKSGGKVVGINALKSMRKKE